MRAAHVVGKDLQLRFGVDDRVPGEQQVLIGLFGIGLLRVLPHKNLAVEDPGRAPVQDPLVEFMAAAVRLRVVNRRVVVDVLLSLHDIEAIERRLDARSVQHRVNVVADERAAQRDGVRREVAAAVLVDLQRRNVERRLALSLHLAVVQHSVLRRDDLGHLNT